MKHSELNLINTYVRTHPDAAARELERHPVDLATDLLQNLPLRQAQRLFEHLVPALAARLLQAIPDELSLTVLSSIDARKAVAILRCLSNSVRIGMLKNLPERRTVLYRFLLSYPEDTVGAWMIADTLMMPASINAADALARLTRADSELDSDALPVVNDAGQPIGLVSARRLLTAPADVGLGQLAISPCPTLPGRMKLSAALTHPLWTVHSTLVVLDRYRVAVGVLRHHDLRCALAQTERAPASSPSASTDTLSTVGPLYAECLVALLTLVASAPSAPAEPRL
ncbi:magnesium transporter MgtE N-terminal domain-containing protein [Saccharospirillum salsuginis]|uniref:CBS domain-containing protein n=1 Tax=Saccharospirillum salsuginis TaxID=418750 RepID=A0A918KBB5_9GAMM|nr:CBS domain-containing protein [Saccharospirillum salsuginis]GGX56980.1 hypothetical protein GCM10007392_25580 [Saccharospirillum salsuginis]